MPNQTSEDQDKIDAYFEIIQERILAPIQNTEIKHHCTITLLLLFAAIDGLGKLLANNEKEKSNERIRIFLDYMGGDYAVYKKKLLKLRHSLVHNAINVESFLSHTEIGGDQHLKKTGATGFIYVNTMVMDKDFLDAFERFRSEIQHDPMMMVRVSARLKWVEDNAFDNLNIPDIAMPSPPPPVQFIFVG